DEGGGAGPREALPPPPAPPRPATKAARRAKGDLVADWERQPPIALSLYLRALATIPGCPLCGKRRSGGSQLEHGEERRQRDLALHANPARPNRARYSSAVRSRPEPVRMSISRSITLAKVGAGAPGTGNPRT